VTISAKTRFDILKRDRFTCAYCGRTPPEVLLHVDHIVPVADGGPDDPENLTTACRDCNLGKGARRLDSGTEPRSSNVEELQERIAQAQAYAEYLTEATAARRDLDATRMDLLSAAWHRAWGGTGKPVEHEDGKFYFELPDGGYWPEKSSIRAILRRLPFERVIDAMEITSGRFERPAYETLRYFYGVCWRMIRENEAK